ncbi:excisionase family DNA binding protein [Paraburkholderia youngii]|uniref:hypothetical protein n=1 Tax=Paraburkholderia youngii TaxID=2782701 RepID=UPI003D22C82D
MDIFSPVGRRLPVSAMTVEETAKYLFVSRAQIQKLLELGKLLEVLPGNPSGKLNIDVASVEAYRKKTDAAVQAWLDSRTEDNEPPWL